MRLIGKERLVSVIGIDSAVDLWVSAWVAELSNCNWKKDGDLIFAYPRVTQVDAHLFIFPIGDSRYCIEMCMSFERNTALIIKVYENE